MEKLCCDPCVISFIFQVYFYKRFHLKINEYRLMREASEMWVARGEEGVSHEKEEKEGSAKVV